MRYIKGTFIVIPNRAHLRTLSLGARAAFIEMCDMADQDGLCFPSRKLLAYRIASSIRSTDAYIEELIERGFITKARRNGVKGGYTSNLYQINIIEEGVVQNLHHPSATFDTTPSAKNVALTIPSINHTHLIGADAQEIEIITESPTSRVPTAKYPHSKKVFNLFPRPQRSWEINVTELKHAELLWERGEDKVRKMLRFCEQHSDDELFYKVTKPSDLERKWEDIRAYAKRG